MINKVKSKPRRRKLVRTTITVVIVLALITAGVIFLPGLLNKNDNEAALLQKTVARVLRGDVSRTLGVSASLNSSEIEDQTAEVSGEVLEIRAEDGDFVSKGDIIMILDTETTDEALQALEDQIADKNDQIENLQDAVEDMYSSIEDRNEYISNAGEDIDVLLDEISVLEAALSENEALRASLNIYAPLSGTVFNVTTDVGDTVNPGTVFANVTDTVSYEVEMPFSVDLIGQDIEEAKVNYMNTDIEAQIILVTDYTYMTQYGNEVVDVVLSFKTDITLPANATVKGKIKTAETLFQCNTGIAPYFADTENITAEVYGEILELHLIEKQLIMQGDLIAVLDSGFIDDGSESLNLQINEKNDQIASINDSIGAYYEDIEQFNENILDYHEDITDIEDDIAALLEDIEEAEEGYVNAEVTANFNGVVTGFMVEAGDDVGMNQKLFTLISLDNPEMHLTIDELDISEVVEGLSAEVVIDALSHTADNPVSAVVTGISLTGNSQGGVTTYTVTVSLTEPVEGFKLGMNAAATVFTSKSANTLYIPIEAVTITKGRSYVYIGNSITFDKTSVPDKSDYTKDTGEITDKLADKRPGAAYDAGAKDMTPAERQEYAAALKEKGLIADDLSDKTATESPDNMFSSLEEYYAGTSMVEVTTGIHNEAYIEILSGLAENQIVVLPPIYISSESTAAKTAPGMNDINTARKAIGGIGGGK